MSEVLKQMIDKPLEEKRKKALERAENPYAEGTRYYDLYQNNPYAPDKFTRQQTLWDRLANSFGMRSSYDAAQDEWAKAASEYDAQIAQLKGEDEYNSEAAKAERMRAAGLNPDLQGIGEASEAGEFAQEQTSPDINRNSEDVDRILGAISRIPQAVTFAMGMAEKGMHLNQILYETKEKKASWAEKLQKMAESFIDNFTPLTEKDNYGGNEKMSFDKAAKEVLENAGLWAEDQGFTKKEKERFVNNVTDMIHGGKKEDIYKKFTGLLKARKEYGETKASKYTPKTDDEQKILGIVGELVNKWDSTLLHQAGKEENKAKTEEDYWNTKNGITQAAGENAKSTEDIGHGELVTKARKAMNEAIEELKKYTKEGSMFALGLESTLAILQLKYLE